MKNGWKIAGITESGLANLQSIDSFADIYSLITEPTIINNESPNPEERIVEREVMLETGTMIQIKTGR